MDTSRTAEAVRRGLMTGLAFVITLMMMPAGTCAAELTADDDKKEVLASDQSDATRLGRLLDRMEYYYDTYEYVDDDPNEPPTFNTVSILDTDILDTDDIVAVERFAFCSNAYGVAACVEGGDKVVRGVLDSVGSTLPVGSSHGVTGHGTFWDLYGSSGEPETITWNEDGRPDAESAGFLIESGDGSGDLYYYDSSQESISALDMYKSALRANKVDIITIGYLNNLYDLLTDPEGLELVRANLNAVYVTGGSLKGLGDCNFDTSAELLKMSIYVTDTLRDLGIYTVYLTGDLGGVMNTPPFDAKCAQAFATVARDSTPSWDVFSVWTYVNRANNPHVSIVRSALFIKPDSSNVFVDGADCNAYRVVKLSPDEVIRRLL